MTERSRFSDEQKARTVHQPRLPWPDGDLSLDKPPAQTMEEFSRDTLRRPLRAYQAEVAEAILASVFGRRGLSFAVAMSRQAGKNELSAQVEAYLLTRFREIGGQIVKASPTYRPQALNSMMRLAACLDLACGRKGYRRSQGYIFEVGRARALFFSAQPTANVIGATADLLLECDEAQSVDVAKWDKDFAPMAASTNATRVYYGTVWTPQTLLARQIRALQEEEQRDGRQRVFLVPWPQVAAVVPAYGEYVRGEIARLGSEHPLIKTQYLLQEIDAEAGMFPPLRQAQMRGTHPPESEAEPGQLYAMLIDVAGEFGGLGAAGVGAVREPPLPARQDSTALTVVKLDLSSVELLGFPTYRVVHRHGWTGIKHPDLYGVLLDLARNVWPARYVVVDATGVGAGLASFLGRALGERVIPYVFNQRTKSDLGWGFLSVVDMGRFKDHSPDAHDVAQAQFWREVAACRSHVLPGLGKLMRWGVEDPLIHDDFVISAALCWALDALPWRAEAASYVIEAPS